MKEPIVINLILLGERYYVTFALWHGPFTCRLSSVTFVHPTQRLELLSNIFAESNSLGTWTICVKILNKSRMGSR